MSAVQQYRHTLISLQNLITTCITDKEIVVTHGYYSKDIPNSLTNNINNYRIGEKITHWSFLSTSFDPSISLSFSGKCCLLVIKIPKGTPVLMIQSTKEDNFLQGEGVRNMGQAEIVLPAGLVYQVTGIEKNRLFLFSTSLGYKVKEINIVELEVVGSSRILI